ncbi:MAG TPA: hypothetical protein VFC17_07745 [Candidatus Limnocylindrales bacterium]|nr:hypothetical protein [Candidatus Limnocylindrales bacterium]
MTAQIFKTDGIIFMWVETQFRGCGYSYNPEAAFDARAIRL